MIGVAIRAWALSLLGLTAASTGMASLTASSSTTSLWRMALAAGVLSCYAATIGLVVTPRFERTWFRSLLWGGLTPLLVGIGTGVLAGLKDGLVPGLLAAAPWLAGVVFALALGDRLPAVPWPRLGGRDRSTGFH